MLSPRELQVLCLTAQGFARKQIASELEISIKTVDRHLEHIYTKLKITYCAQLIHYALHHRLIGNLYESNGTTQPQQRENLLSLGTIGQAGTTGKKPRTSQ